MPTVGVVIPCRNEARWLPRLLDALAAQGRRPDEIVVVDDGSTDGTATVVEEWRRHSDLNVRVIAGPARGVAAAANAGVAALATDIVVRLDGHCLPAADYIARAVALASHPDVGVAGGVWVIEPSAATLEAEAIAIAAGHKIGSGGAMYRSSSVLSPTDVDTVPFGCFGRSLWQALGGFDEGLQTNEDYDFNYRVRQRGFRVVLDPAMRCVYYARPTVKTVARQYGRYGWWKARMLMHHPGALRWRQVLPALLVPALLAAVLGVLLDGGDQWRLLSAIYPAVILLGAVHAAGTRDKWPAVLWLAATFITMHVMWSAAFWASLAAAAISRPEARP